MPEDKKEQMIHLRLDDGLLKRLEDFRFKQRFESRTAALRWLLDWGLKQKPAPGQKGD
jgi:hypothetical protein